MIISFLELYVMLKVLEESLKVSDGGLIFSNTSETREMVAKKLIEQMGKVDVEVK